MLFRIRDQQVLAANAALTTVPDRFADKLSDTGLQLGTSTAREVSAIGSRQELTTQTFGEQGQPTSTILPSGRIIKYKGAPSNPLNEIEFPGGERIELGIDQDGNIASLAHHETPAYRFKHDDKQRLTSVTYPDKTTTNYTYGDTSLENIVDRTGATTTFYTDENEGRHWIEDPLGRRTTLTTGEQGQLEAIEFADGSREEYQRDKRDDALEIRRRDGSLVRCQRTGGRASLSWPDGRRTELSLDPGSQTVVNETSTLEILRGEGGAPTSEHVDGREVRYEFDSDGRLTCLHTPFGETIHYVYDEDGRLVAVVDWDGVESRFEHTEIGAVRSIRYGNTGLVEERTSGRLGLLESARVAGPAGACLSEQRYEYDDCDRLTSVYDGPSRGRERGATLRRFTHDAEGRILSQHDSDRASVLEYSYDVKGNMVRDGDVAIEVGDMDEPLARGEAGIKYDRLGNATKLPFDRGAALELAWNGDGTLADARMGASLVRFAYDPIGRRVEKTSKTSTWRYGWAGAQLLWEERSARPGAPGLRRDYLYLPDGTPFAFRERGETYWLQTDPRGAVIRVFDSHGTLVWSARYDPFGAIDVLVDQVRQPLRLLGQYEDAETGLYYNVARYYSPWLKTYLSLDPSWLALAATNYSYANNAPWDRVDPSGALAFLAALGVIALGGLVGAGINAACAYFFGHGSILAAAVNGFISGAFTTLGVLLGGFWGGVAGGFVGTFLGTLVESAMNGQGWCWSCALRASLTGLVIDLLTLGLSRIPIVRRVLDKASEQLDDLWRRLFKKPPVKPRSVRRNELAQDPAHNGAISNKTLREADIGLDLEEAGKLKPPITRDPNPAGAEFIDGDGVLWDIKAFDSRFKPRKGGFELNRDLGKIEAELAKGENVILDTVNLTPEHAAALREAIENKGIQDNILWYP